MLQQADKFRAIVAECPNIPFQDLANVADRIQTAAQLLRVAAVISAYVRHAKTSYDLQLRNATPNGAFHCSPDAHTTARYIVEPQVRAIMKGWK